MALLVYATGQEITLTDGIFSQYYVGIVFYHYFLGNNTTYFWDLLADIDVKFINITNLDKTYICIPKYRLWLIRYIINYYET